MKSNTYMFRFIYQGQVAEVHVFAACAQVWYNGRWMNTDETSGDFATAIFYARMRRG